MAVIKSGNSTDQLTIDPVSKAARQTLYKSDGTEIHPTTPADTQPVSISGSVPVTGSVSVSNFPSSQPVTGPLTDTQLRASAVPVSGTFFQATQPISAVSLPLPANAAIESGGHLASIDSKDFATQTTLALIKAKTDNLDVLLSTRTKPADSQHVTVDNASIPVIGTFFQATQPVSAASLPLPSGAATSANQTTANTSLANLDVLLSSRLKPADTLTKVATVDTITNPVAVTGTFFQATQPVSGSVSVSNFPATQPVSGTVSVGNTVPTTATDVLTKGTQGATGFSVQSLKDAGRTYVTFTALAAAGVTSEALLSLSQNKQGTVTASVTSYTIPSGKTLRITALKLSIKSAAAAAAFSRVILRHNTAGATTASSPVVIIIPEINTNSVTSGFSAFIDISIPDGVEFRGDGTQSIGFSHLDQATTNILNFTAIGFEY